MNPSKGERPYILHFKYIKTQYVERSIIKIPSIFSVSQFAQGWYMDNGLMGQEPGVSFFSF